MSIARKKYHLIKLSKSLKFIKQSGFGHLLPKTKNDKNFKILVLPNQNLYNELFVKEKVWVITEGLLEDDSCPYQYLASLIIHELKHLEQFENGKKFTGAKAEKEAYLAQKAFLFSIKYFNAIEWLEKQYKNKWWKRLGKQIKLHKQSKKLVTSFLSNELKPLK